jgi:hypothetical protein
MERVVESPERAEEPQRVVEPLVFGFVELERPRRFGRISGVG